MEKQQLLDTLNNLIGKYQSHRQYIDKAKTQLGKFSSAVIEKVVLDHEIKSSDVADEVNPLLPQLDVLISGLETERSGIHASKGTVDEEVQELELRMLIGEMEAEDFDAAVTGLRETQNTAADRLSGIEGDLKVLSGIKERWVELAVPAGHYSLPKAPAPAPEQVTPAAEKPVSTPENKPELQDAVGAHMSTTKVQEDVGPVFPEPNPPATVKVNEEEVAIETAEGSEDSQSEVQFSLTEESAGLDAMDGGSNGGEVEIDFGEPGREIPPPEPGQRRALLLYQEGTAEEQIYPFQGDQLTVGRGRENDIQIKNDSKVSRYHCRITRRGNNFYIEDVKSSNGTLVNGELVTERRLFGGEEVIIGETFFRFRIMD